MPKAATARKLPEPEPKPKARKKPRPKAKVPKPRKPVMTPSEKHKVILAGVLLAVCLLAVLIHSGECIRTSHGCLIHFHDLRGDLLVSLDLSLKSWPKLSW